MLAGGDGWDSAKLYEIAQGALDGGFFTNHYAAENPSPVVQDFVKKYEAAYHAKPDAGALGYDAAPRGGRDEPRPISRPARSATRSRRPPTCRASRQDPPRRRSAIREVRGDHRHREERAEVRDDRRSLDEDGRGSARSLPRDSLREMKEAGTPGRVPASSRALQARRSAWRRGGPLAECPLSPSAIGRNGRLPHGTPNFGHGSVGA